MGSNEMQVVIIGESAGAWLATGLDGEGFRPVVALSLDQVRRERSLEGASLVVIEVDRRSPDAVAVVRRLREDGHDHPILILSDRAQWRERVESLDAGADDYVTKPVRAEEIAARLRAIIRRSAGGGRTQLPIGRLALDLKHRTAFLDDAPLVLTKHEFRLLQALAIRPDRTLTQPEIRELLYHTGAQRSLNAVEVLIARLRSKIGRDCIRTVRGVGYRLDVAACARAPARAS